MHLTTRMGCTEYAPNRIPTRNSQGQAPMLVRIGDPIIPVKPTPQPVDAHVLAGELVNIRILHPGWQAPLKWDSRNRHLWDPCFMWSFGPLDVITLVGLKDTDPMQGQHTPYLEPDVYP